MSLYVYVKEINTSVAQPQMLLTAQNTLHTNYEDRHTVTK